jgi:DNA/RNA endonuclease YhcR with UshA esterase domain
MIYRIFTALLFIGFTSLAWSHHSIISQYDMDNVVTINGEVTEVWYQNPHSRVYLNVTGDDGEVVLWESETYPRNILHRRGWKQRDLNVGDVVEVTGRMAKDGSPRVQILEITRPADGWEGVGYDPDSID